MNPDLNVTAPLTKKEFNDRYWFSPLQMVTLINPKTEDYRFMVEMRHFVIRGGATESFPGTVANVYLSQMTRILAQDNDEMNLLSDVALMAKYYDSLMVDVKNMAGEDTSEPAYMKHVLKHTVDSKQEETPPWQQAEQDLEKPVPETPPTQEPVTEEDIKPFVVPAKPKEGTKEFEYNGLKFKAVTDKKGVTSFFKNDLEINEADYAKAASMI